MPHEISYTIRPDKIEISKPTNYRVREGRGSKVLLNCLLSTSLRSLLSSPLSSLLNEMLHSRSSGRYSFFFSRR